MKENPQNEEAPDEPNEIDDISQVDKRIVDSIEIDSSKGYAYVKDPLALDMLDVLSRQPDLLDPLVAPRIKQASSSIQTSYSPQSSGYRRKISKTSYMSLMALIKSIDTAKLNGQDSLLHTEVLGADMQVRFAIEHKLAQLSEGYSGNVTIVANDAF